MNCAGLIMAGGRSERMRASGCNTHKALRTICGVPLLERNLIELMHCEIKHIWVTINRSEDELQSWLESRGQALATAGGAKLRVFVEEVPLGTIGAAGHVAARAENLLVFNVDNLTTLDLQAFVKFHISNRAALTVATHDERFRIPFGQVQAEGTRLTAYREKPEISLSVSSGIYVVHRRAIQRMPRSGPVDAPGLIQLLLDAGEQVASYWHNSWWIDVNDEAALARAEEAVSDQPSQKAELAATAAGWRRAS